MPRVKGPLRRCAPLTRSYPDIHRLQTPADAAARAGSHATPRASIAFKIVNNLRMQATSATFGTFPAATSRSYSARITGLCRRAARAPMYSGPRTSARPPQVVRAPRRAPLSRASGATPADQLETDLFAGT